MENKETTRLGEITYKVMLVLAAIALTANLVYMASLEF